MYVFAQPLHARAYTTTFYDKRKRTPNLVVQKHNELSPCNQAHNDTSNPNTVPINIRHAQLSQQHNERMFTPNQRCECMRTIQRYRERKDTATQRTYAHPQQVNFSKKTHTKSTSGVMGIHNENVPCLRTSEGTKQSPLRSA